LHKHILFWDKGGETEAGRREGGKEGRREVEVEQRG